jgi:hypothetical protein
VGKNTRPVLISVWVGYGCHPRVKIILKSVPVGSSTHTRIAISTSDNYDSSDDDKPLPSELVKNPNAMIKGLMRQVGARDGLLEQQEELLVQETKISEELKNCLFKKEKLAKNSRSLTKNLLKARRLLVVSRAQLVLFNVNMMSY